jgi:hypothetical protein
MDLFKPPNINATTPQGQINQIKDYLFKMVQQLNFVISTLDKDKGDK